jgi:hypothetical protein
MLHKAPKLMLVLQDDPIYTPPAQRICYPPYRGAVMPGRSTQAEVEPAILTWARSSAGLSIEEAAHSLQTNPEKGGRVGRG